MSLSLDPAKIVTRYLLDTFRPGEQQDWLDPDASLVEIGLLRSIDWVELVIFLENQFKIQVEPEDLSPENFGTVTRICNYLKTKIGSS